MIERLILLGVSHQTAPLAVRERIARLADANGDGKLTEEELLAYLDHREELQKRVQAGCVTLEISDQSRGLFDLLDVNRDGRLSVREMRQAPHLLKSLDRVGKGYLMPEDLPRSYRIEVRRGPAAEVLGQDPGIIRKVTGQVAIRPAASIFQRLGKIPVIHRAPGADSCIEQSVG